MATAQIATNVSLEEFLDGIADKERYARCEYWDGEVILKDADFDDDMSPVKTHSFVQIKLGARLEMYLEAHPIGTAFTELHCILPGTRRVLVPDLAVVLGSVEIDDGPLRGAPNLAIEILSPSDRASLANRKVTTYLDRGVRTVWLIDPAIREATVYRDNQRPYEITAKDLLEAAEILPGFSIVLESIFPPRK